MSERSYNSLVLFVLHFDGRFRGSTVCVYRITGFVRISQYRPQVLLVMTNLKGRIRQWYLYLSMKNLMYNYTKDNEYYIGMISQFSLHDSKSVSHGMLIRCDKEIVHNRAIYVIYKY